jgi:hypothetical protein
MGGFSLFFPGSGSFLSECRSPKHLTDSSAGAELNIASWAGKTIIPVRMLQAELRLGPSGPTTLEIDASAMLDGIAMDKVSRKQRFQAARLAMLRLGSRKASLHSRKKNRQQCALTCFPKLWPRLQPFTDVLASSLRVRLSSGMLDLGQLP